MRSKPVKPGVTGGRCAQTSRQAIPHRRPRHGNPKTMTSRSGSTSRRKLSKPERVIDEMNGGRRASVDSASAVSVASGRSSLSCSVVTDGDDHDAESVCVRQMPSGGRRRRSTASTVASQFSLTVNPDSRRSLSRSARERHLPSGRRRSTVSDNAARLPSSDSTTEPDAENPPTRESSTYPQRRGKQPHCWKRFGRVHIAIAVAVIMTLACIGLVIFICVKPKPRLAASDILLVVDVDRNPVMMRLYADLYKDTFAGIVFTSSESRSPPSGAIHLQVEKERCPLIETVDERSGHKGYLMIREGTIVHPRRLNALDLSTFWLESTPLEVVDSSTPSYGKCQEMFDMIPTYRHAVAELRRDREAICFRSSAEVAYFPGLFEAYTKKACPGCTLSLLRAMRELPMDMAMPTMIRVLFELSRIGATFVDVFDWVERVDNLQKATEMFARIPAGATIDSKAIEACQKWIASA
ncbi:unnamed protein product (mitochondrion) [Plasmodiophora brassicae]|uniref:Uncharacterized protein n=1 Tax=Plasmodiophora brassicae TaxID=37360 RepID=A0A0G4J415_PLABS|nr:hypothetical protein PBRA_008889 [Plasmodiophora brassicae]SPR01697.1 unnamed protein product [Plasmodiophora brassicae]